MQSPENKEKHNDFKHKFFLKIFFPLAQKPLKSPKRKLIYLKLIDKKISL